MSSELENLQEHNLLYELILDEESNFIQVVWKVLCFGVHTHVLSRTLKCHLLKIRLSITYSTDIITINVQEWTVCGEETRTDENPIPAKIFRIKSIKSDRIQLRVRKNLKESIIMHIHDL